MESLSSPFFFISGKSCKCLLEFVQTCADLEAGRAHHASIQCEHLDFWQGAKGGRDAPLLKMGRPAALICCSAFSIVDWSAALHYSTVLLLSNFTINSELFVMQSLPASFHMAGKKKNKVAELYKNLTYRLEFYLWGLCSPEEKEHVVHFLNPKNWETSCAVVELNWRHSEPHKTQQEKESYCLCRNISLSSSC